MVAPADRSRGREDANAVGSRSESRLFINSLR